MTRAANTNPDGSYIHKLDVLYDGEHHEVTSHDAAWHLALKNAPAKITDLEQ